MHRSCLLLLLLASVVMLGGSDGTAPRFRVLVFSKTAGFRHASIPAGIAALQQLGAAHRFAVDATEEAAVFTLANLERYGAVVFLNTTGNVLDEAQQAAFQAYIRQGGGFVGIHGAADAEYDWPWYGGLIGAYFESHPEQQEADILVLDRAHPSMRHLPARWPRFDEWYNYRANPRGSVHVLAVLDERSYEGGPMGHDHPIAWAHVYDGGRAWYTGLGHTDASYEEPLFLQHVLGGIEWAAGAVEGDVGATLDASFEKVVLTTAVTDPMELGIARDGRVFIAERAGAIKMWDPETDSTRMIGYIPVNMTIEDGLLGLTLDPGFDHNHWLYVYYAPAEGGPQRLSRLTFNGDQIEPESERILLEVPVQREKCCHSAGSLTFGPDGTLYLSTGDNSDPYPLGGSPLDERPGHEHGDAQRTSANTNDLRGKILRIRPLPDGTYAIPEGNLFPGDALHRPEIYIMGNRNPFRIAVDPETGWLYWGDVGIGNPPSEDRGPWGWEEFNHAREPGFFGWPYFVGPNEPYRDYDYVTDTPGSFFNPEAPVNDSPNNTGARALPPARPAMIWYTYGPSEDFPELEAGGMSAMGGPVYRYSPETASSRALPPYYHGSFFIYEWMRHWMKEVKFDENGNVLKINPFLTGMAFSRPMDVEVGPDGRLYVIEWGEDFWGSNEDAQVVRLDYYGSSRRPPVAAAAAEPVSGPAPLHVRFAGSASRSQNDGGPLTYAWDFDGDGQADAREPDPIFTYRRAGHYTARLTVSDVYGMEASAEVPISVGNTAPSVSIVWPPHGGIFDYGAQIDYEVKVTDPEDRTVRDEHVLVQPYTGHDTHMHPLRPQTGAKGTLQVTRDYRHVPDLHLVDRFAVLKARYTDAGAPGVAPASTHARVVLQPRRKQAEHTAVNYGAKRKTYGKHPAEPDFAETALVVLEVEDGHYVAYDPINLLHIDALTFRVKPEQSGTIELRLGGPIGPLLAEARVDTTAEAPVPGTAALGERQGMLHDQALAEIPEDVQAAYEGWREVTVPVADPGGTHALYLVFRGAGEATLMQLDWIDFNGRGIARTGEGDGR